jgi:hypothetical protein
MIGLAMSVGGFDGGDFATLVDSDTFPVPRLEVGGWIDAAARSTDFARDFRPTASANQSTVPTRAPRRPTIQNN